MAIEGRLQEEESGGATAEVKKAEGSSKEQGGSFGNLFAKDDRESP